MTEMLLWCVGHRFGLRTRSVLVWTPHPVPRAWGMSLDGGQPWPATPVSRAKIGSGQDE